MIYRPLGNTGFETSVLGLGGESALYKRSREAARIIERAFDLGINYFDTAPVYHDSELNLGDVLPPVRRQVFVATKVEERGYDGARRQIDESMRRLRTDYLDLVQIHSLDDMEEVDEVLRDDGAVRAIQEAKDAGVVRLAGVSGHADPEVLLAAIDGHPFDAILMALNPAEVHVRPFQRDLLPEAVRKGMGIMAMKVLARGLLSAKANVRPQSSIHYVLSLPVSNVVLGVMNQAQLERDVRIVQLIDRLGPMSQTDMRDLEGRTKPFARELNFYRKGGEGLPFPSPPNMVRDAL
jgi:aryl-alcohol dehydrogenase-like predicted oxidoreductase